MTTRAPEMSDHPLIQADALDDYISSRLRAADLNLYSAFMLAHEATRIRRLGYLKPSWRGQLSISGLLRLYMLALTAAAFGEDQMAALAREWFASDARHLVERRPHFFLERMAVSSNIFADKEFSATLSEMRQSCDSLSDDDGPFHLDVFPWDYAAPEREMLNAGTDAQFKVATELDAEVEALIVELCTGDWA